MTKQLAIKKRRAVRAVVIDNGNKTALIFDAKNNHYAMPGGGIEINETLEQALHREIMEEAGCKIKSIKEIGKIIEYRNRIKLKQISYCWLAQVDGKKFIPKFTKKELANKFELTWVQIHKAVTKLKLHKTQKYNGIFIRQRNLLFFNEAYKILKN